MSKQQLSDKELFEKLAESLGVSIEQIIEDYEKIVEEVKKDERFVGVEKNTVDQIARNRLITRKRRELASPAITWEGVVLGVGDLVDTVMRQRQMTEEAFKLNAEKTLQGWIFGEGDNAKMVLAKVVEEGEKTNLVPLYPPTEGNKKWGRAGKPLPDHSWLRNVFGVAAPIDKKTREVGTPQRFTMTISDKRALEAKKIVMNKGTRFKGINKTTEDDTKAGIYRISDSTFTTFELASDLKLPPIETVLTVACVQNYKTLSELEEYHLSQNAPDRWVVTEGTVSLLSLEPHPKTQNMRMVLDDESLLFVPTEEKRNVGVTCWIPTDRSIEIDFAQDSRVYVVGKTTQGKAMDPITREVLDEPGDVMINVYGIFCPEMFKVKLVSEPDILTEASFAPKVETPAGSETKEEKPEEESSEKEEW